MNLTSLQLSQFRCFETLRLGLEGGMTLFHGNNAQGKTSILEAACVLLRLQSPRATSLSECIRFSEKAFAVGGRLEGEDEYELRFQYRESGRRLLVDGESQGRSGNYLNYSALVVWMANDDLALVRGGGEGRRRFLDFMASQIYPGYRNALKAYEKALRSRNYLLKRDASPRWPEVDAYTKVLHDQGAVVTSTRRVLVEQLKPWAASAQADISGSDEKLALEYENASGPDDDLIATLLEGRGEELRKRQTLAGPHRDDIQLVLNGMPAAKFASEGQQRTVALALKLGQANLFHKSQRSAPVILIDDVFGELDPSRRNALMDAWPKVSQKLITTTNLDWLDGRFDGVQRFQVEGAEVS